ncbi:MAG TPA: prenyltransferase/squalene oxidase repeat-containing protein [Bryobacteraceae bacterium]|nr:prenyltransferase/squalene oxidase repeat-containing protein [Bryobacteraceae bacterium]
MTAESLELAAATLIHRLLDARNQSGHWEGKLSSSALSTATAAIALSLTDRGKQERLIEAGIAWLASHRNSDGGWGDTVLSLSNVSTTALAWAAFAVAAPGRYPEIAAGAEAWLVRYAGSLDPGALAAAIERRYGNDRTFSIPILTVLALAGKLGQGPRGWRRVMQLPFELAAFPQKWFHALSLPVVSYALPALIAIGQLRHHRAPSRNPLTRTLRNLTREPTLRLLDRIQPSSGGFLEATPLTSFVVMSLAAAGRKDHPVAARGIDFLTRSCRPDGSWAIDTNLATWVTTLSVNALAGLPGAPSPLGPGEREAILSWLLGQQYRQVHPYTLAAPGGWAWTDLPGGVPDADDTPGAVLALHNLAPESEAARESAIAGIAWLADLQNADGGIPTFCHGWGKLPFDRSSPDLTAHALLAWGAWFGKLEDPLRGRVRGAAGRALAFLAGAQQPEGCWIPLWFGNQFVSGDRNPVYGTARVLIALAGDLPEKPLPDMIGRAVAWLCAAQNSDGGWGGAPGAGSSIEETAVAVHACAVHHRDVRRGVEWLLEKTRCGAVTEPSPIGFYFASLWYFEELYPLIFAAAALRRARLPAAGG